MNLTNKLTKRNVYISLFAILYGVVAVVSLIHSFAFFGLANDKLMAIMLGTAFEIGQAAVLFSILTSAKDRSRVMPWILMCSLTLVQVLGNVFSSYKYLMNHAISDLRYFKEPIFVWTTLPDNVTTVIITYIVGAILPIIALCMTSMVANYLADSDKTLDEPAGTIDATKYITETPVSEPQVSEQEYKKKLNDDEKRTIEDSTTETDAITEQTTRADDDNTETVAEQTNIESEIAEQSMSNTDDHINENSQEHTDATEISPSNAPIIETDNVTNKQDNNVLDKEEQPSTKVSENPLDFETNRQIEQIKKSRFLNI